MTVNLHTYTTTERVDEWGNMFVDVALGEIVVFTFDTGYPPPGDRVGHRQAHDTALHQFALRLRRSLSD